MDERDPDEFDTARGARLALLMDRAVAADTAPAPLTLDAPTSTRPARRWAIGALAAAATIAVVAAGVIAVVGEDDGTGTLRTADGVRAPADRSSMWRVPAAIPEAFEAGWASTNPIPATLVAVDDPGDVGEWVVVSFMSLGFEAPVVEATTVGTAHIFYRRVDPTGGDPTDPMTGDIFHAAITGSQSSLSFLSIMSHGVDETRVRQAAEAMAQVVSDGVDAGSREFASQRPARLQSMLDALASSPVLEGLTRLGPWDRPEQPMASIGLTPVASSAQPTTTTGAPQIMTGPPPEQCTVTTQANPGRAATTIIDGLYARSTFGPMIVPGELAEIDIPGATAWWTSPGLAASGPTSKGLRVADGGALVEISCSAPAEDSPDEVGAWATTIAEGLEPVADQAAFRAAMGRRGVTVTDD